MGYHGSSTLNAFYLGTWADLDICEGDDDTENAGAPVGAVIGGPDATIGSR